ncbi:MAG: Hsp70 family protein [Sedimentisphaerales bacterium]|nr:Hsp70 family protein [Sedimentisphaerales bacterium]
MVRLGIDFGTTNTVAVLYDRGLFCVVLHEAQSAWGTVAQEIFPSTLLRDRDSGVTWCGLEADRRWSEAAACGRKVYISSLKRRLRDYAEGQTLPPDHPPADDAVDTAGAPAPAALGVAELLTDFLRALADSIRRSLSLSDAEPLETVITWPANANGAQRYVTRQCFRAAGFRVIHSLNEPTACAIELADCLTTARAGRGGPLAVAVFDLGGGTFDASLVHIDNNHFQVLASAGLGDLGGDDFDQALLDLFFRRLKVDPRSLGPLTRHALRRQIRAQKETLSSGAVKSLFLNGPDFGIAVAPVTVSVDEYYRCIRPLIQPAIETLKQVIQAPAADQARIPDDQDLIVYLVGGSSKLPLVQEMVRAALPRSRMVLSDKPFRSVAMGAAIAAAGRITYRDIFARHFGLLRLRDHGRTETFDAIFPAGTPIPARGEPPLEKEIRYHPAHNIGHLRYLECTAVAPDGLPAGTIRNWSDILFPYDPACPLSARLTPEHIEQTDRFSHLQVGEVYRCDADGVITVELQHPVRNERRRYEIYQE